jgi:hypothetical protein
MKRKLIPLNSLILRSGWMVICLFGGVLIFLSACGSPLVSRLDPSSTELEVERPQTALDGKGLSLAYGCPLYFENLQLCAQIFWFDNQGLEVSGPIYWEMFPAPTMTAEIWFWDKEEGWPIDPVWQVDGVQDVQLKLYMPTHGHGSDWPELERVEEFLGRYRVKGIDFIMLCDEKNPWEVRLQLRSKVFDPNEDPHTFEDQNILSQAKLLFGSIERRSK